MPFSSLTEVIDHYAGHHAGARRSELAILGDSGGLTWSELQAAAARFAPTLARFPPGTRVVLLIPQQAASVAMLAACDRARLSAVLVSQLYGEKWARTRREELGARAVIDLDGDALRVLEEVDAAAVRLEPDADGPAVLVLTSGTTGAPRCARHTWRTLAAAVKAKPDAQHARWLVGYPLSHFAALQVTAQALWSGGTLQIPPDFSARTALALLAADGAQYLCSTPSYVRQLLLAGKREDWARTQLRQVTLGGEIADQQLLDGIQASLPGVQVTHIYASTELGAILTVKDGREGFDAALVDGQRLKIVDGELFARSSSRAMEGYVDQVRSLQDWVATGDLVEVLGDRVFFRGRRSEIINVGGYKVSPIAVEAVIREVAGVREACVVAHKSSILGAMLKALVATAPDVDRVALQAEITRRCSDRLAPYMVPRLFAFSDRIERSVGQKIVRRQP